MGAVIVLIYFELRCHEEPWSSSWLKTTADVDVEDGTLNIMDHLVLPERQIFMLLDISYQLVLKSHNFLGKKILHFNVTG